MVHPLLLAAAALVGSGSAVLHPESSRVARMAAGNRPGLAQSVFQLGGNLGSAIGPLFAGASQVHTTSPVRASTQLAKGVRDSEPPAHTPADEDFDDLPSFDDVVTDH